jgi:hypothetical protein
MSEWERLETPFELKFLADEPWSFKGHAAIFNSVDRTNDEVMPGAFKRSIDHHKGKFPVCWMHVEKAIIGRGQVVEDGRDLAVEGKLNKNIVAARDAHELMLDGTVDAMSFAYRPIKFDRKADGGRKLRELALGELTVGPASMVCHPEALITEVKFFETKSWEDLGAEAQYCVRESGGFEDGSMSRFTLKKSAPRVEAVWGKLKATGRQEVQALRFPKLEGWTLEKARAWVDSSWQGKGLSDWPELSQMLEGLALTVDGDAARQWLEGFRRMSEEVKSWAKS